jgi:hypothetical protein
MLATLGALSVEWLTGVTWQDAGKVELVDGSSYSPVRKTPRRESSYRVLEILKSLEKISSSS